MRIKNLVVRLSVLAALLAAGRTARAGSAGAEPFDFLFLDVGARAVAMGGAYTALPSESEALHYNPAALGRGERYETMFMHNQYLSPITQEYVGFASPRGWGAQLNYLTFGRVARTTISSPDGTGGTFGINDMALGFGYGREMGPGLRAGAAAKILREQIDNVTASAYAADLGALYALPGDSRWTLGAALQNIGPTVKFQQAAESLPWLLRLGAAREFKALDKTSTLALDILKQRSQGPAVALGAETWVAPSFAVRLGFDGRNDAGIGITAGFGWKREDFQFDYALSPLGELGSAHRLSATLRWGNNDGDGGSGASGVISSALLPPVVQSTTTAEPDRKLQAADEFLKLDLTAQAEKELVDVGALLGPDDPRQIRRSLRLGDLHRKLGRMAQAKSAYTDALTLAIRLGLRDSNAADSYAGMGYCLVNEKKDDLAIRFFEKALEAGATSETSKAVQAELLRLRKR